MVKITKQIIIAILLTTGVVNAKTFSADDLVEPAFAEDCLDYCVDGVCFWLVCSFWGCKVKTTPHINHNLPDFVVSSYNHPGENSFKDIQFYDKKSGIDGGHLSTKSAKKTNSNLKFKESSVIGNPVAYAMGKAKYLCKSNIDPYMPYYLSTIDNKMWRSNLSETFYPSSWIPGMNEIGEPFDSWGSLYPRGGFLNQPHDVKASSVIAARSLEVVSDGGLRIYQNANCGGNDRHKCYGPKEGGKWQMISPKEETQCSVFGKESVIDLEEKIDDDGQYGWTAWRNYGCCVPGPGKFIGSVITGCLAGK